MPLESLNKKPTSSGSIKKPLQHPMAHEIMDFEVTPSCSHISVNSFSVAPSSNQSNLDITSSATDSKIITMPVCFSTPEPNTTEKSSLQEKSVTTPTLAATSTSNINLTVETDEKIPPLCFSTPKQICKEKLSIQEKPLLTEKLRVQKRSLTTKTSATSNSPPFDHSSSDKDGENLSYSSTPKAIPQKKKRK